MRGYQAYSIFHAMNLHFRPDSRYDCIKYNFKTKCSFDTFNKDKSKWQFIGVENDIKDLTYAMYCVFESNDFKWLNPRQIFRQIRKFDATHKQRFLDTTFKKDLVFICDVYDGRKSDMFSNGAIYPHLYEHYMKNEISIRTMILLDMYVCNVLREDNSRDIISWSKFIERVNKIKPILSILYSRETIDEYLCDFLLKHREV